MIAKSTIYETPGGYRLRVDQHGNVNLTEPTPIIPGRLSKPPIEFELCFEDIGQLAAMFDIAARDYGVEE